MKTKILVLASAIGLLASPFGFSQVDQVIRVNVPFQFTVEKTVLPAGEYDITRDTLEMAIQVVPDEKGERGADATVVTRLSGKFHNTGNGQVVFDKIGDTYTLSEVWFPEMDGFLLSIPKAKHTHRVIQASK